MAWYTNLYLGGRPWRVYKSRGIKDSSFGDTLWDISQIPSWLKNVPFVHIIGALAITGHFYRYGWTPQPAIVCIWQFRCLGLYFMFVVRHFIDDWKSESATVGESSPLMSFYTQISFFQADLEMKQDLNISGGSCYGHKERREAACQRIPSLAKK